MAEPVSLSPGSDNPPDQKPEPFTEEELEALIRVFLNARSVAEPPGRSLSAAMRLVLEELARRGRLLPAGTPEITEQWSIKRGGVYYPTIGEHPARSSVRAFGGTLLRQVVRSWPDGSQRVGPWEVVE